jgi:hypothetical protein
MTYEATAIYCPKCKAELQGIQLACASCLAIASLKELVAQQAELLPHVAKGDKDLALVRVAGNVHHILLFGSNFTWCGRREPGKKIHYLYRLLPPGACPICLEQLQEALAAQGLQ